MHWLFAGGLALTSVGLAGYVAGIAVPYPGRAFSVTASMVGCFLVAIDRSAGGGAGS